MAGIAAVIIASRNRERLLDEHILPRVLDEQFDEVVVVGDYHAGSGYRYLSIPPILGTTIDALIKRDAGTVATVSPILCFFSDDHRPGEGFATILRAFVQQHSVDALIPERWTTRGENHIPLNSGAGEGYCGGHAGVFHRGVLRHAPWTTAPHHRLWDLQHSQMLRDMGFAFHVCPEVTVEDVEHLVNPASAPWL